MLSDLCVRWWKFGSVHQYMWETWAAHPASRRFVHAKCNTVQITLKHIQCLLTGSCTVNTTNPSTGECNPSICPSGCAPCDETDECYRNHFWLFLVWFFAAGSTTRPSAACSDPPLKFNRSQISQTVWHFALYYLRELPMPPGVSLTILASKSTVYL